MSAQTLAPTHPQYTPMLFWLQCEHAPTGARIYLVDNSFYLVRLHGEEAIFYSLPKALAFCHSLITLE
jgi:hypothetical protein